MLVFIVMGPLELLSGKTYCQVVGKRGLTLYETLVMCVFDLDLQVQSDHFEEFFSPELEKHGYAAVYKKKTAEVTPLLLNRKFTELVMRTSICPANS